MPTKLMPFQAAERRAKLIEQIEAIIQRRDANSLWPYIARGQPKREDYVAALRLLRAKIDLDSPTILKVSAVLL